MYYFSVNLKDSFDNVLSRVTAALKTEGFGVLADIDVAATLKAKLGIDKSPYRILGACNPAFANEALTAEPDIGVLLPCNVVVRKESDSSISVVFMDPKAALDLVDKPEIRELADKVRLKLLKVRDMLENTV